MKKVLMSLLIMTLAITAFAQTDAEQKVWDRVEALTNAIFVKRDSAALLDIVNDKVTYGHSGGAIEDKPTMIHKAMVSKTTYRNQQFEKISIQVQDRVAIVRHNFRAISIDENGKETPLDLGILQVWKKEGNKWRIWARQAVKIAPKS
ncbi:MAG TPA: nuclear transport factor 2 family protein [Chitinophagaceae bacterium]|nr:nuclear transport factor 2 family protein [Chitinophagaceae bacterium]